MKIKKLAAALLAATTALIPLSSNSIKLLPSSISYAAEYATGAALPEWIPQNYEEAQYFRNTYGATHIKDGLVCIVFREHYDKVPDGEPQGILRYEIKTTQDMMNVLTRNIYGSEDSEYCYEVIVYYSPQKQGDFEVALVDTWIKSSDLDLGYNHAVARYKFSIDEENEITETDIYGWLPDCYTEYYDFRGMNGSVCAKDEFVVFCIDDTAGIRNQWEETSGNQNSIFNHYISSYCSRETSKELVGGSTPHIEVYKAVKDGKSLIKWSFVPSDDYQMLQSSKNLIADCTVSDNASKVTLNNDLVNNAEFYYNNYSVYGTELTASGEDAYAAFAEQKSAVIKSKSELTEFLTPYLNEEGMKGSAAQYNDKFFENNVLLVNTFLDPYKGRISAFGLDSVCYRDNILNIDYAPIVNGAQSRTSCFSILQVTMPKEDYKGTEVIWRSKEALADNIKRISIINEDTGGFIDMGSIDPSKLFGIEMKNIEGQNPYFWDVITAEWLDLDIDEKYLPTGYELSKDKPRELINYGNNTGDITFRLKKTETSDIKYGINKYSTTTRNLFTDNFSVYTNISKFKPVAIKTVSELTEITSQYFSDEYRNKIFEAYDENFFKKNVLLLNLFIDSTGGDKIRIDNTILSGNDITVYYTKPAPDFQVCNTDFLFILHAAVPKKDYTGQNVMFKCIGDANGDGDFGIADLVTLQKWLLSCSDTKLDDWRAVDLCKDDSVDIFDLVAMRKEIVRANNLDAPKRYFYIANYHRSSWNSGLNYPLVKMITSVDECDYFRFDENSEDFKEYDENWFKDFNLLIITLSEPSGSIWHEVTELTNQYININRFVPPVQTADMAAWDILIKLEKDVEIWDDVTINLNQVMVEE